MEQTMVVASSWRGELRHDVVKSVIDVVVAMVFVERHHSMLLVM